MVIPFRSSTCSWGRHLRACPPCPGLLRDICDLESEARSTDFLKSYEPEEFYDVVQWLKVGRESEYSITLLNLLFKTFPDTQTDSISCFEQYLETSIGTRECNKDVRHFNRLDNRWKRWQEVVERRTTLIGCTVGK